MRYVGQEHAVTVDLPLRLFQRRDRTAIKRAFDAMHAHRYGTIAPDERAEIVELAQHGHGHYAQAARTKIKRGGARRRKRRFTGRRHGLLRGRGFVATPTYERDACSPATASSARR